MATKDKIFGVRVSEKLLEEYQKFCDENSMNASKRIRKYMENDIAAWKKRQQKEQNSLWTLIKIGPKMIIENLENL